MLAARSSVNGRVAALDDALLPISVLEVWRWIETVMIRIVGRRVQGKSRWSVGRMVFRPVRLKTRTSQQFGSGGSYAVFTGIRGSCVRVQRRYLLRSSLVGRSFLKYTFARSLILASSFYPFPVTASPTKRVLRTIFFSLFFFIIFPEYIQPKRNRRETSFRFGGTITARRYEFEQARRVKETEERKESRSIGRNDRSP